ncbi:putative G-protein coupled receptor 83 [Exaiptasia diaphana]|nr:putative G-protein coupled receptor 83 [Exaiptasia diaphana]
MNSSNESLPVLSDMAFTFRVMRWTLYPLVMFSGILGNIVVALVITLNRPRDLKPSVRYFILNLAISDLIVLVMFIPFDLAYLEMSIWVFGEAMCKIVNTLNYAFVTVSGTTLAAISLDRHRSIVYPIKKPLSTRKVRGL